MSINKTISNALCHGNTCPIIIQDDEHVHDVEKYVLNVDTYVPNVVPDNDKETQTLKQTLKQREDYQALVDAASKVFSPKSESDSTDSDDVYSTDDESSDSENEYTGDDWEKEDIIDDYQYDKYKREHNKWDAFHTLLKSHKSLCRSFEKLMIDYRDADSSV